MASMQGEYEQKKQAELLTREEDQIYRLALELLERYALELEKVEAQDGDGAFALVKTWFGKEQDTLEEMQDGAEQMLEHVFDFMELVFGTGQEMVVWITELNSNYYSVRFLQEYDCERYYRYNKELLFEESSRSIEARLQEL